MTRGAARSAVPLFFARTSRALAGTGYTDPRSFRGDLARRGEPRREVMEEPQGSVCPGKCLIRLHFGQLSNHPSIFRNEPLARFSRHRQYEGTNGNRHLLSVLVAVAFATLARAPLYAAVEGLGSSSRDTDAGRVARENTSRFGREPETFERAVLPF